MRDYAGLARLDPFTVLFFWSDDSDGLWKLILNRIVPVTRTGRLLAWAEWLPLAIYSGE